MSKRYFVTEIDDDTGNLESELNRIAIDGGRVFSVLFQPAREGENSIGTFRSSGGFIVIAEYGNDDA